MRVALPDRPGSLGQVARTLGVAGADIVQVVVLERMGGRAIDDFTVVWPGGSGVERLKAGLSAMPGVRVDGIWRAIGAPVSSGCDAELLAQVAGNPADGVGTLVDAVPGLLATDWAAALSVPAEWASRRTEPELLYASWRAPKNLVLPEITPIRPRSLSASDGTKLAVVPFGQGGLVLLAARVSDGNLPVASFHGTEVDRLTQLVRATAVLIGDRHDALATTGDR